MVTELMVMGFDGSSIGTEEPSYGIDDLYSIHDKSEYGVSAIQVSGRFRGECYEELAPVCVGTGICHRKNTLSIVLKICFDLIGKGVSGAIASSSVRRTGLNDEIFDNPVKGDTIVETRASNDWLSESSKWEMEFSARPTKLATVIGTCSK